MGRGGLGQGLVEVVVDPWVSGLDGFDKARQTFACSTATPFPRQPDAVFVYYSLTGFEG